MSKALSLKLKEDIFGELESIRAEIKKPRNTYINEAIAYYNRLNRRKLLAKKLRQESARVRENSLEVLSEYEQLPDEFPE